MNAEVCAWIESNYGYCVDHIATQPQLRHTFTHFHLDITPVRMKLVSDNVVQDNDNLHWYVARENRKSLGMSTPVKKLINKSCEN